MENNVNVKGPNKGEMDLREKVDVDVKELNLEEMDQVFGGRNVRRSLDVNTKGLNLGEMNQVYGGNEVRPEKRKRKIDSQV